MHPLYQKAELSLKKSWGFDSFRSGQDEVVQSVIEGNETLVLFPTGGGKSLCYQVPATVFEGLTLVISPLVALMQDQVQQLVDRNISATFLNSTISQKEVEQRLVNARNGMYKLVYCAPERLKTQLFQTELENLNIELIAVDEAHCISEWGNDFRPSYREIRESLSSIADKTRWLALTATATPEVRDDILRNLEFKNPKVISRGFARPNLTWWVVKTNQKRKKLISVVEKASAKGNGLIYGGTRKNCEDLANLFSKRGIKTEAYHAGVEPTLRKEIQNRWISGETPLVAATNAFGMGIDKPDCKYVVHDEMPFSLEAYYQEAGRAGRDGEEAFPILLYKDSDYINAKSRIEQNYPSKEDLEKVYNALCDYLNLAVGYEMLDSASLDLENVSIRAGLSKSVCLKVIELFSQFGILNYFETLKPSIRLQFIVSSNYLQKLKPKLKNADKAEFLDKVERLFGTHSFHDYVDLEEEVVLSKLNVNRNALLKALNVFMQNDQLLIYTMNKANAYVRLIESRSTELPIRKDKIEQHRLNMLNKLDLMNGFVHTKICREIYLRAYFGDMDAKPCGKCDNCRKYDSTEVQVLNKSQIQTMVEALKTKEMTKEEIKELFKWDDFKAESVINYCVREGKIEFSAKNPTKLQLV